jgi:hypothetical protein
MKVLQEIEELELRLKCQEGSMMVVLLHEDSQHLEVSGGSNWDVERMQKCMPV